jgi:hypothetical protein
MSASIARNNQQCIVPPSADRLRGFSQTYSITWADIRRER